MGSKALKLTRTAEQDLEEIFDYTVTRFGPGQAQRYLRRLHDAFETLCGEAPVSVRPARDREEFKLFAVASHVIVFRDCGATLEVHRVLHKRMDLSGHVARLPRVDPQG